VRSPAESEMQSWKDVPLGSLFFSPSLPEGLASSVYAAIDFGISNVDVTVYAEGKFHGWIRPAGGRPDPALVQAILAEGGVDLSSLRSLYVTGGQHRTLPPRIGDWQVISVGEVDAIGRGGQALARLASGGGDEPTLVVSAGSGTAVIAARGERYAHVTGTGVGGGTLLGLSRLLLHTVDHREIDALAQEGDSNGPDLSIGDVVMGPIGVLPPDVTAVNFGRLARHQLTVSREDIAAALVTLVGQTIGLVAINAANAQQMNRIVVIGHLFDMASMRGVLEQVGEVYSTPIILPPDAGFGTALGALLYGVARPLGETG
jgi:type II pantothenate kinase